VEGENVSKEVLTELYCAQGMSQSEIARVLGLKKHQIQYLMSKFEVKTRFTKSTPTENLITVEEATQLYTNDRKSVREIAKLKGVSATTMLQFLKKNNIPTRDHSEATKNWRKEERIVDVDFFTKMSYDLAYVLGLWASDGVVLDRGSFALGMKDEDVIEWVAKKISYTGTIHKTNTEYSTRYAIQFTAPELLHEFERHNLVPRKSLTLEFPDLPQEMIPHFIRGVFDGDGSFFKQKSSYGFSIVSGSETFIKNIKHAIEAQIGGSRNIQYDSRGNGLYLYNVYGKESLYKLGKWIYQDDSFGMSRKKEKFNQLFFEYEQCLTKKDAI
jgi:transposase-like protein